MHENCADCAEYYHTCRTWPDGKPFACADYYRLRDVLPGTTGQPVPPSRMAGRTEPRARRGNAECRLGEILANRPSQVRSSQGGTSKPLPDEIDKKQSFEAQRLHENRAIVERCKAETRAPSPAASYSLDGQRLCGCGVVIAKRRRCCDDCRRQRREQTRTRSRKQPADAA